MASLTSFLAVRPTAHASRNSIIRVLATDAFTSHSRRSKAEDQESAYASEGFGAYGGSAGACEMLLGTALLLMLCAASVRTSAPSGGPPSCSHIRRLSSQRLFAGASHGRMSAFRTWTVTDGVAQRRHVSSHPQAETDKGSVDEGALQQKILDLVPQPIATDLEEAWEAYQTLQSHGALLPISCSKLLKFASQIAAYADCCKVETSSDESSGVPESWEKWALRVQTVLSEAEARLPQQDSDLPERHWRSLTARVLALRGQIDDALAMARQVISAKPGSNEQIRVVAMFHTLFIALAHYRGPTAVLELVISEWYTLSAYLDLQSVSKSQKRKSQIVGNAIQLRRLVLKILQEIQSPTDLLASVQDQWPAHWRQRASGFLIYVFAESARPGVTAGILQEAYRQKLHVSGHHQLAIVKGLARLGIFDAANPMFATIEQSLEEPDRMLKRLRVETGLYLFARQGNILRTLDYFSAAKDQGINEVRAVALLLHAYRVSRDPTGAVNAFNAHCVDFVDTPERPPNRIYTTIAHYTEVIAAHAIAGDREGTYSWLGRMARTGITPDRPLYKAILKGFAALGELDDARDVVKLMRSAGIHPSHTEYTMLIAGCAAVQNATMAKELYKQALAEGIVPDPRMMNALHNANVDTGSS